MRRDLKRSEWPHEPWPIWCTLLVVAAVLLGLVMWGFAIWAIITLGASCC